MVLRTVLLFDEGFQEHLPDAGIGAARVRGAHARGQKVHQQGVFLGVLPQHRERERALAPELVEGMQEQMPFGNERIELPEELLRVHRRDPAKGDNSGPTQTSAKIRRSLNLLSRWASWR
jgi:cytochrome c-type biogenesis protein CcmH/NrfG